MFDNEIEKQERKFAIVWTIMDYCCVAVLLVFMGVSVLGILGLI